MEREQDPVERRKVEKNREEKRERERERENKRERNGFEDRQKGG